MNEENERAHSRRPNELLLHDDEKSARDSTITANEIEFTIEFTTEREDEEDRDCLTRL